MLARRDWEAAREIPESYSFVRSRLHRIPMNSASQCNRLSVSMTEHIQYNRPTQIGKRMRTGFETNIQMCAWTSEPESHGGGRAG